MSCKSAIYTNNSTNQTLNIGDTIDLGSIIRRFGNNLTYTSNGISLLGKGYYDTSAEVTVVGTSAGTVTISLLKDGVVVPGAVASTTTSTGNISTIGINALIREFGCCCNNSVLTLVIGGDSATVSNISVVVEKI